jgi:hypothetical protein
LGGSVPDIAQIRGRLKPYGRGCRRGGRSGQPGPRPVVGPLGETVVPIVCVFRTARQGFVVGSAEVDDPVGRGTR